MPTKNKRELLNECGTQTDSLFITLGRLLYENIQAGSIAYYFDPEDPALMVSAKRLIRDVVQEKIFDRKEKKVQGQAPVKEEKPQEARPPEISRRGQIEPYTQMNVALRVAENRILDVQKDLNDCLSAGLLHTTGERTAAYQAALDEKIQKLILLMAKKREEIKLIMETKKKFFADNPEVAMWKAEKSFLEKLEQEVNQTTKRVDDLIDEVVVLFKNINTVYEKDLEQARVEGPSLKDRLPPAASVPEYPQDEPQEEIVSQDEPQEETLESTQEEESLSSEQEDFMESPSVETDEAAADYGLLETAGRKLSSESTSDEDKLAVLHTIFRNAPKRAVPLLYELTREADIFFQRKLLSLLSVLDYPTLVDLYRRFINDEDSSLRLQGMMGLVKLGSDEAKHVIVSAIRDPDPHIRRFIVNHLDHRAGDPEASAIARLSADIDEGVARVAIRKLGLMGNHFAFVTLVPKLESSNIKVCKETIEALISLTGTDQGYDYSATLPERKRQARVWKALAKESYIKPRLLRDLQTSAAAKRAQVRPAEKKGRK
ncbi:MAG: HEAT repeat domain-containing protein [Candidatus Omnitrophica bacterium]|nr:HEAT repeat domain-containing protein [Candidatus Omnitrophota bacterium]